MNWLRQKETNRPQGEVESEKLDTIRECKLRGECRSFGKRMLISRHIDLESDDIFMLKNFSKPEGESTEVDGAKLVDPLHWYGLLAPQSLKDAQSRFVKGTATDNGLIV